MTKKNTLIKIALLLFIPSVAYAHGEQIIILFFSDIVFLAVGTILIIAAKFRYASKSLLFCLIVILTFIRYLLPAPEIYFLLHDSFLLKALGVAIHVGPTIIICWIASALLKQYKIKKGISPRF